VAIGISFADSLTITRKINKEKEEILQCKLFYPLADQKTTKLPKVK
jgi:hypothetical protein